VLIGAAFNSSLDEFFPRLSGIVHEASPTDQPVPAEKNSLRRTLAGVRARRRTKSQ
jgi:hypothetical protein